jgi:cytochrome c-type biogenesis protein CcmE
MRLIGVTVVILAAIAALVVYTANVQGAKTETVTSIAKDSSLVGKQVKVGGAVVAGSWNKQSNPMKFTIREESDKTGGGPTLKVVYTGTVPNTFGDGVVAIITGKMGADGVINATDMITKCPSKYETQTGAIPVADLVGKGASLAGKPVRATGFVKPGSIQPATNADRFFVASTASGSGAAIAVNYGSALPAGMKDGSSVVISGELDTNGKFVATSVALSQK